MAQQSDVRHGYGWYNESKINSHCSEVVQGSLHAIGVLVESSEARHPAKDHLLAL